VTVDWSDVTRNKKRTGEMMSEARVVMLPTEEELLGWDRHHSTRGKRRGWRVRMRRALGYFGPETWYQAVVSRLVTGQSRWVDVGGGHSVFPQSAKLSRELADRCELLVGVDPSENILRNEFVHQRSRTTIQEYQANTTFHLATLRMVAEHITNPDEVAASLARLVKPDGCVVIYTPNRWSLITVISAITPNRWHASLVRLLTPNRQSGDVFPAYYRMNMRRTLKHTFETHGFREVAFTYLDDSALMQRFRFACFLELIVWKTFHLLGIAYPENNILAIYQNTSPIIDHSA